jgi:outer membrane protein assembly factor BamB
VKLVAAGFLPTEKKSMRRRSAWVGGIILGIGLVLTATSAEAVITAQFPLKDVLANGQFIFMAKVEKIDSDKPALILKIDEKLKGKPLFEKLPINLTSDSEGQKLKHTPQLLKRLAPDLPLVVFINQRGKRYDLFAFTNGTWFQVAGYIDKDDPAKVRWAFLHCEPYLRRTFKGTTAELRQVVIDGMSGTKAPPEPDPKEPPGLGPEIQESPKKTEDRGSPDKQSTNDTNRHELQSDFVSIRVIRGSSISLVAVIPTFVIMGPLALLASLFPAVFGGLAFFMKRWMVLLWVACLDSTLYFAHQWFQGSIKDYWWGTPTALWMTMAVLALAGIFWSCRRHRLAAATNQDGAMQLRQEDETFLRWMSYAGIAIFMYCLGSGDLTFPPWKKECLALWTAIWIGTVYVMALRRIGVRRQDFQPAIPAEGVVLGILALAFVYLGASAGGELEAAVQSAASDRVSGDPLLRLKKKAVAWKSEDFEPKAGNISSSPLVEGERVFVGAFHQAGFSSFGAVYCLDRATGKKLWRFDDDGDMKPVFSSPCLADGRLYIGEGFHQDFNCKFYCLNAETGQKIWDFQTTSHTESSPTVAGERVFFGAGDDGLYCLDAKTGKKVWHFTGLHVDTNPTVSGHRLFAGSGYGTYAIFCLDTQTGKPLWMRQGPEQGIDLPSFASPTAAGAHQVFFGLGNGDFINSDANPAGALLCVDAKTGETLWCFKEMSDAVHGKPAVDSCHVYFGSRDGHCYCLDRKDGREVWQQQLGSPIVASVVLGRCPSCGACPGLYVAASGGKVFCLGPNTGQQNWMFDAGKSSQAQAQLLSTPALILSHPGSEEGTRLYFGAGLRNLNSSLPALFCLEDESGE